jgi:hypothetical protein
MTTVSNKAHTAASGPLTASQEILNPHLYNFASANLGKFSGNYLEIGIHNGFGAAMLAKQFAPGNPYTLDKQIYAVDPFVDNGVALEKSRHSAMENISTCGNLTWFDTTSAEFARDLTDEAVVKYNVSWITIDGSQLYEDLVNDYRLAVRLLNGRVGVIVFNDYANTVVKQACDECVAEFDTSINYIADMPNGQGRVLEFIKL